MKKRIPKSLRKYLRSRKAQIRRDFSNGIEAEGKIRSLTAEILKQFKEKAETVKK